VLLEMGKTASHSCGMAGRETQTTIRFDDADPAGVVFYPRAIALAHDAVEDMIRATSLEWHGWFAHPETAAPVRQAEADFFHPMRPGETFATHARVDRMGETSVHFVVEFADAQGAVAARVRTVHVFIDRSTGRPVPLTDEIRSALAPFAG
jgi:YbgC/YbaW family acyl-CoA thioester hydrolase